jgi:hypothetical protein
MDESNPQRRRNRSKKGDSGVPVKIRNPLLDYTLDEDLKTISLFADKYKMLDEKMQLAINQYVFEDKPIEYYHGSFVATYQLFLMADQAKNDMASPIMTLLCAICFRIMTYLSKK